MSSQEENVALAREALAKFQRGDLEGFLEFLDPQVEIVSPPELPNPVRATGRDAFLQWLGRWLEAWETFDVEAEEFEPVGERYVLIHVIQRGVGKGSGVEVEMRGIYMLQIADGLGKTFHLYPERGEALEAALAGEKAAADQP
jgi:ketosteroid isomerase-like protein